MIHATSRIAAAVALTAALSACGTEQQENPTGFSVMRQAATQIVASRKAEKTPVATPDPSAMAAEALRVNPGPLILVGLENAGTTQVLAMTGENNGMRTYMTKNEQSIILHDGMLVGTRGLGNDLSVAEAPQTKALVLAGRSGQSQRVMRYYSGDGLERPLPLDCRVGPGPKPGVMVEDCTGLGLTIQNSYIASGGRITVSRQWIGPALGYMTIQTLR